MSRRFSHMGAGMQLQPDPAQCLGEAKISRGGIDGVAVQYGQGGHLPGVHRLHQLGQRRGGGGHRVGVGDGAAGVAQRRVQPVDRRVLRRRLGDAGDDDPLPFGRQQRLGGLRDPGVVRRAALHDGEQAVRHGRQRRRAGDGVEVGLGAGQVRRRGGAVERKQPALRRRGTARGGPVPRAADEPRPHVQEVARQGNHDLRPVEVQPRFNRTPECRLPARIEPVARHRRVRVPPHLRIDPLQRRQLRLHLRRRDGSGQHPQPLAPVRAHGGDLRPHALLEPLPGRRPVQVPHRLRPERVVQPQHGRLRQDAGAAAAPGVLRVALHLERPAILRRHQHAVGKSVEHRRGGVGQRDAGLLVQGVAHVRHLPVAPVLVVVAPGQPGQRERRRHHLQEAPPVRPVSPASTPPGTPT